MESHDAPAAPVEFDPSSSAPSAESTVPPAGAPPSGGAPERDNMLPRRGRRRLGLERLLVRLIATCGIVGIGVLLGAILVSQKVSGWITGLVIALVTVILSAVLWSSRQL